MQPSSGTPSDATRLGLPLPPGQAAAADDLDAEVLSALPRLTNRKDLPVESPGRMVLANHQSVFVTLRDVSRGGCCVVRKGNLALKAGERVQIEMWREDIQTKASLAASVRWVRHHDGKTKAGLRFLDSSVKTHRLIDQYLQRSFSPGA